VVKSSFWFPAIFVILIFAFGFFMFGFTYDVPCPKCGSDGKVTCGYCNGQGKKEMPIWKEGEIVWWVLDDCPVCEGTGTISCNLCGGTGSFWMFSTPGSSLLFFLIYLFSFLIFFGLDYAIQSVYLERNPWVRDIREMSWGYFRPMYWTWLFYHDRKRWVKYSMALLSICTPIVVLTWSLVFTSFVEYPRMTAEVLIKGSALGTILLILFVIICYLTFAKKTMTNTYGFRKDKVAKPISFILLGLFLFRILNKMLPFHSIASFIFTSSITESPPYIEFKTFVNAKHIKLHTYFNSLKQTIKEPVRRGIIFSRFYPFEFSILNR
jgi:hypothetical protein